MSVDPVPEKKRSSQQTLQDITVGHLVQQFPSGVTLRYETDNPRLEEFILNNKLINYIMFNFTDAKEVIEEYGSLHDYLSAWQVPIVVATEHDRDLQNRTMEAIRTVLAGSEPAIYTPDAGRVYLQKKENGRTVPRPKKEWMDGLNEYMDHVELIMSETEQQDWEINILPLAKAMNREQCRIIKPFFKKHGFTNFAYYTRQYCNHGNHIKKLVDHIDNFIQIVEPKNVLAIARLGPNHLKQFPPEVTGVSGLKQFIDKCEYNNKRFSSWRKNLEMNIIKRNRLGGY